jgi:hypothetical protein
MIIAAILIRNYREGVEKMQLMQTIFFFFFFFSDFPTDLEILFFFKYYNF